MGKFLNYISTNSSRGIFNHISSNAAKYDCTNINHSTLTVENK